AGASVQIRRPMLYAALICVIAAVPVLLVAGLSAAFFRPLAWSYMLAVIALLVVAMTVTPALSTLLFWRAAMAGPRAPGHVPGVRNAAAQVGRALLSHDVMDVNSAVVWVSLDPKADYEGTLAAMRKVVAGRSGITGEVQTYLSKQMRERLTGEDNAVAVRVFGQDLGILRQKAQEVRDVLATIPGIKSPQVEQQAEQQEIQIEVDL